MKLNNKFKLTSPASVTATVCIPPHMTCKNSTSSTSLMGAGLFRSRISSPRPSCPTSP